MESATMFLSARQAAEWLGLSMRTLERYRGTGEGPVFYRFGRHVCYLQADLEAWAKSRRRTSTRDEANVCRAAARRRARRWLRRATVDRRGRRGLRRAIHDKLGPRDVQPGRAWRKRRPARAKRTDRGNDAGERDNAPKPTLKRSWTRERELALYDQAQAMGRLRALASVAGKPAPHPGRDRSGTDRELLTVLDARLAGKSWREAAVDLHGAKRVAAEWDTDSWMRSRVRRLGRRALMLMEGGYRNLVAKR